ncbi:MAG: hypothetical protein CMM05_02025 [Rhodopirellula sp.]|nr:hypothetical protein [Rhodopirellula sp.]
MQQTIKQPPPAVAVFKMNSAVPHQKILWQPDGQFLEGIAASSGSQNQDITTWLTNLLQYRHNLINTQLQTTAHGAPSRSTKTQLQS